VKTRTRYEAKAQALANHLRKKAWLDQRLILDDVLFDPMVDPRHIAHIARKR